ncbi:hypothetical protein SprV_0100057400 [Sparganum proliferum]
MVVDGILVHGRAVSRSFIFSAGGPRRTDLSARRTVKYTHERIQTTTAVHGPLEHATSAEGNMHHLDAWDMNLSTNAIEVSAPLFLSGMICDRHPTPWPQQL